MKVVCVVDSITDLNKKIETIKSHFGNNILYVVKASLMPIFETYNYTANAVYDKNLSKIIHVMLSKNDPCDIVIYYTSLEINSKLISDFIAKIGNKTKIVNFMPKYNSFESMCLGAYNVYVKSIFKIEDCLASPKLQFLPTPYIASLLESHIGNKMFKMPDNLVIPLQTDDANINKSAKIKTKFGKSEIIALIVAMVITLSLILTYAFFTPHFVVTLLFILFYLLDLTLYLILKCKSLFDLRFLK